MNSFKNHLKCRKKSGNFCFVFQKEKKAKPNKPNHFVQRVGAFKRENGNSNKLLVELARVALNESQ